MTFRQSRYLYLVIWSFIRISFLFSQTQEQLVDPLPQVVLHVPVADIPLPTSVIPTTDIPSTSDPPQTNHVFPIHRS